LTSSEPFQELRTHFQHFLFVQTEEGKELCFRFYDPRVLRGYLPSRTGPEAAEFFGPVRSFLMEGAGPETLVRFTLTEHGAAREQLRPVDRGGRKER
jgi:hypothetical protein